MRPSAHQRFDLRVALQALSHVDHTAGDLACSVRVAALLHRFPKPPQPLPVIDEPVGALRRIDADFGFRPPARSARKKEVSMSVLCQRSDDRERDLWQIGSSFAWIPA